MTCSYWVQALRSLTRLTVPICVAACSSASPGDEGCITEPPVQQRGPTSRVCADCEPIPQTGAATAALGADAPCIAYQVRRSVTPEEAAELGFDLREPSAELVRPIEQEISWQDQPLPATFQANEWPEISGFDQAAVLRVQFSEPQWTAVQLDPERCSADECVSDRGNTVDATLCRTYLEVQFLANAELADGSFSGSGSGLGFYALRQEGGDRLMASARIDAAQAVGTLRLEPTAAAERCAGPRVISAALQVGWTREARYFSGSAELQADIAGPGRPRERFSLMTTGFGDPADMALLVDE